ncbi:MAG: flavin reductase family protein, partial [Sulfuritalea sp.]|nr:flavin reductase family protein [Sulfuritalea sp.]
MTTRIAVPLPKAYLLLNHGPTVLVSSAHGGRRNVMAAAWNMALDFDPPKVAVVIDKATLTRELVAASGEFVLNVPARQQAAMTLAIGTQSGREIDKFQKVMRSGIPGDGVGETAANVVGAPLIEGCLAWLECRVIPEPHIQKTYDLFLAEVVAAWADPEAFSNGRWHFPGEQRRSIHYQAGGNFL